MVIVSPDIKAVQDAVRPGMEPCTGSAQTDYYPELQAWVTARKGLILKEEPRERRY